MLTATGLTATAGTNKIQGATDASNNRLPIVGIERVIGGSAVDELAVQTTVGGSNVNHWTLQGKHRGNINQTLFFEGFENLIGGDQDDRFVISFSRCNNGSVEWDEWQRHPRLYHLCRYTHCRQPPIADWQSSSAVLEHGDDSLECRWQRHSRWAERAAEWNIQTVNAGSVLDAAAPTTVSFEGFENIVGGDANDVFKVAANGKLTGKQLVGTLTPGLSDTDKIDLSAFSSNLQVHIHAINHGIVQENQRN